jgi:hypothetical protein
MSRAYAADNRCWGTVLGVKLSTRKDRGSIRRTEAASTGIGHQCNIGTKTPVQLLDFELSSERDGACVLTVAVAAQVRSQTSGSAERVQSGKPR